MRRQLLMLALLALPATLPAQARPDSLDVRLTRAIASYHAGQRDVARREFLQLVDLYNARGGQLSAGDQVMVATALTYLGKEEPQVYKDALTVYDRAIAAEPNNLDARVKLAELFLDRFQSGDAQTTLKEVFDRNPNYVPALVLDAKRRDFASEPGADSVLAKALEKEPENVPGRVLRARFLADVEDWSGAQREIDRALRAAPNDAGALATAVALAVATGDSSAMRTHLGRYRQQFPKEAGAHVAVAEQLGRVRQYAKAAQWASEGARIDSINWQAHSVAGMNLLRLGRIAEGRAALEIAFRGDPYNVWSKNTLDLLDTFKEYDEIDRGGKFRFMIEKAESPIISLYLGELMDRAYDTFVGRYGFTPSEPVRVEVYRSHADFSVRTVGLSGLGALGVSFGNTVAFDSPAAKDAGMFNWASTAWHELAHTFTLGATDMRIPRWLSEGLSVYEERRGRKGWGQNVSPGFLKAYMEGKLTPPSKLNDGFVRPTFPQQVIFSYYMASLVCELIVRDFGGERALMEMLQGYRRGLNTEQVFQQVLKTDLDAFDKRFDAYMRLRFGQAMSAVRNDSYTRTVTAGRNAMRNGDTVSAIATLERARAAFPDYGGADGAYPLLVRALMASGDKRRTAEVLTQMVSLGDVPYETHIALANLLLETGDTASAAHALESAIYMNPYELVSHELLAGLYRQLGDRTRAIRERRAVVALNPVDKAEAYYQLAVAYREAGATADARRSVVRALEDAPHFERAQELLLQLHEARRP